MAGFPNRILRAALGAIFRDRNPVEDPELELGAEFLNLLMHQATGAQLVCPKATLIVDGATSVKSLQEEAWNVDHSQTHPTFVRASAGVYTYTFASTYLDMDGVAVATVLNGCRIREIVDMTAGYSARKSAYAWIDSGNPLIVNINTFDAAGSASDSKFWLDVA